MSANRARRAEKEPTEKATATVSRTGLAAHSYLTPLVFVKMHVWAMPAVTSFTVTPPKLRSEVGSVSTFVVPPLPSCNTKL